MVHPRTCPGTLRSPARREHPPSPPWLALPGLLAPARGGRGCPTPTPPHGPWQKLNSTLIPYWGLSPLIAYPPSEVWVPTLSLPCHPATLSPGPAPPMCLHCPPTQPAHAHSYCLVSGAWCHLIPSLQQGNPTWAPPGHHFQRVHLGWPSSSSPCLGFPKPALLIMTTYSGVWRRKWQPTPVFLPGKSHGQRSPAGYRPWGCKESDTTEATKQTKQCLVQLRGDLIFFSIPNQFLTHSKLVIIFFFALLATCSRVFLCPLACYLINSQ